jgi:hypothetical protein
MHPRIAAARGTGRTSSNSRSERALDLALRTLSWLGHRAGRDPPSTEVFLINIDSGWEHFTAGTWQGKGKKRASTLGEQSRALTYGYRRGRIGAERGYLPVF